MHDMTVRCDFPFFCSFSLLLKINWQCAVLNPVQVAPRILLRFGLLVGTKMSLGRVRSLSPAFGCCRDRDGSGLWGRARR
jgi:hypothetical protein